MTSSESLKEIIILTSEPFPQGMAGTNRIISLSKGFLVNGMAVRVICMVKTENCGNVINTEASGIYEGINFTYLFKSTVRSKYKPIRIFDFFYKSFLVFLFCLRSFNKNTFILYYSSFSFPALYAKLACILKGGIIFKEETEHPLVRITKKSFLSKYMFIKFHYKIFDGLFVITNHLKNYFSKEMNYNKPIELVPMIVDVDRFPKTESKINNQIVFTGELDDEKEGLSELIKAFSIFYLKNPKYSLHLYGKPLDPRQVVFLKNLISELEVENCVFIHDYLTREKITNTLMECDILMFTRPPSLQAEFGFSTKLGEYLATGKPVISTLTGETSRFLIDRRNAYICQPTKDSIYSKLCEVIIDYDTALNIGEKGRECVLENFNNKKETRKILDLLFTTMQNY